jgi:hypothetical protein
MDHGSSRRILVADRMRSHQYGPSREPSFLASGLDTNVGLSLTQC